MLPIVDNIEGSNYENLVYRFGRIELHKKVAAQSLTLQKFEGKGWKDAQHFPFNNAVRHG
jgi:hypothetical protein